MLLPVVLILNRIANWIASILLAPVQWVPGWVSATVIAILSGLGLLLIFKYTSNQQAIRRTRNQIRANVLAISLFRDSIAVSLRCQGNIIRLAMQLMAYAIVPLLLMTTPVVLMLSQLALRYQARPLRVGEEAIVSVRLLKDNDKSVQTIRLAESPSISVVSGPVRSLSKNVVFWNVGGSEHGNHRLTFQIGEASFEKEFIVGDGFQPVSLLRPSASWQDALYHPAEPPFEPSSLVQSIEIDYPERDGMACGSKTWLLYWIVVSMLSAYVFKSFFNVSV